MRYEIRAMSAGEILDTGFRLLCNHFVELVGISAIVNVPFSIAQSLLERDPPASAAGLSPMLIVLGLVAASSWSKTTVCARWGSVWPWLC